MRLTSKSRKITSTVLLICPLVVSIAVLGTMLWTWCVCLRFFDDDQVLHQVGFWSCANTGYSLISVAGAQAMLRYKLIADLLIHFLCYSCRILIVVAVYLVTRTVSELVTVVRWFSHVHLVAACI